MVIQQEGCKRIAIHHLTLTDHSPDFVLAEPAYCADLALVEWTVAADHPAAQDVEDLVGDAAHGVVAVDRLVIDRLVAGLFQDFPLGCLDDRLAGLEPAGGEFPFASTGRVAADFDHQVPPVRASYDGHDCRIGEFDQVVLIEDGPVGHADFIDIQIDPGALIDLFSGEGLWLGIFGHGGNKREKEIGERSTNFR